MLHNDMRAHKAPRPHVYSSILQSHLSAKNVCIPTSGTEDVHPALILLTSPRHSVCSAHWRADTPGTNKTSWLQPCCCLRRPSNWSRLEAPDPAHRIPPSFGWRWHWRQTQATCSTAAITHGSLRNPLHFKAIWDAEYHGNMDSANGASKSHASAPE